MGKIVRLTEGQLKQIIENTILKEQYKHIDDDSSSFYSGWVNEKNYQKKKEVFVWDTKEYLTGHFGTVGIKKEKQIMKMIGEIFDHAMSKPYSRGISFLPQISKITRYLGIDDERVVFDIISNVFNQD